MILTAALFLILYWGLVIGVVLLPVFLLRARRTRSLGVKYLILYVGVYLALTLQGDYVAGNSVKQIRVEIDHFWWCPLKCGMVSGIDRHSGKLSYEKSMAAVLFWPLLLLDRAIFHPDQPYQPQSQNKVP